jgi:D-alanyl-D-alanine carboxypeptidase (penicillin-binding protein 5/6)
MRSPARVIGIIAGSLVILGLGLYAPAMLLGPLPSVTVRTNPDAASLPESAAIALPEQGASALVLAASDGTSTPLAAGGVGEPVPMGSAAKLVTLLVTLDSLPLPAAADGEGPMIKVGPDDYTNYLTYVAEDTRTLQVSPGDSWSERDVVRAVLLTSSNNHADMLARWAFGGVGPYADAANAWLAENGFTSTAVVDATGLSGENLSTATEVAALAALAFADPSIASMLEEPGRAPLGAHAVPDLVDRIPDDGVREVTRGYTDPAALSSVFTTELAADADSGETQRVVGAMLTMPDYETLDPAISAAVTSATAASAPITVIAEGTAYAEAEAAWGASSDVVATVSRSNAAWGAEPGRAEVTVEPFSTSSDSRDVGRVTVTAGDDDVSSPLRLTTAISDPGPIWRLTHPVPVISAFIEAQGR